MTEELKELVTIGCGMSSDGDYFVIWQADGTGEITDEIVLHTEEARKIATIILTQGRSEGELN